uniref:Kazal-like domain-containing protein n=1 Tax=Graphocephala atropunctata TaxID=36148 RepID=A0A1B6LPX5_9HEMI
MRVVLSLLVLLYIGGIYSSQQDEPEDEYSDTAVDSTSDNAPSDAWLPAVLELANGDNLTPEEAGETLLNSNSQDESQGSSVDKKFFFWPWGWGWGWGSQGCRKRICYSIGSYALIPVCGYDITLGYRSFRNSCFLNATNTCYQTNYILNHTGVCY